MAESARLVYAAFDSPPTGAGDIPASLVIQEFTGGPTMAGLRCANVLLPFSEMHLVSSLPSRGYPPFRAPGITIE